MMTRADRSMFKENWPSMADKDMLDQLPGIILCGFMADCAGRKPVLVIYLAGIVLEEVAACLIC